MKRAEQEKLLTSCLVGEQMHGTPNNSAITELEWARQTCWKDCI